MLHRSVLAIVMAMMAAAGCGSPGAVPAAPSEPEAVPAKAPDEGLTRLIADLGASNWKVREKAAAEIRKIGKPALPVLKKAMKSSDLQVASSAEKLVGEIDPSSIAVPDMPTTGRAVRGMRMWAAGGNGAAQIAMKSTISGDDGTITTSQSAEEVTIELVPKKGKGGSYSAKNWDEFKKKYPEVYKKYGPK